MPTHMQCWDAHQVTSLSCISVSKHVEAPENKHGSPDKHIVPEIYICSQTNVLSAFLIKSYISQITHVRRIKLNLNSLFDVIFFVFFVTSMNSQHHIRVSASWSFSQHAQCCANFSFCSVHGGLCRFHNPVTHEICSWCIYLKIFRFQILLFSSVWW